MIELKLSNDIEPLKVQNQQLLERIAQLIERIVQLEAENAELRRRLGMDSTNSH